MESKLSTNFCCGFEFRYTTDTVWLLCLSFSVSLFSLSFQIEINYSCCFHICIILTSRLLLQLKFYKWAVVTNALLRVHCLGSNSHWGIFMTMWIWDQARLIERVSAYFLYGLGPSVVLTTSLNKCCVVTKIEIYMSHNKCSVVAEI